MTPDGNGGQYSSPCPSLPTHPFPFHLLEVTLISAQDLFPASRSMRTYAVAFVHLDHPLRTRVDSSGHTDPTWNDKFVFRVDDATLSSDTSAIHVDIYSGRPRFIPGPDTLLGTARAVLSTLRPSPTATRFVALQVRRPTSLRPQGILNVGVSLVNDANVSLYADLPAFAFHDLIARKTAQSPSVVVEGTGSAEKETMTPHRRLKKWRSEIRVSEEHREWEKAGSLTLPLSPGSTDDEGNSSRRGKQIRRPRAMSCFNLAGMYVEVADDKEGSSTSSRSSTTVR